MTDTSLRPTGLLLDLQEQAVGVRGDAVRFSWIVPMLGDGRQRSHRIQIAEDPACTQILWDSGTDRTADSTGVLHEGLPLRASTPYWWRVRVTTSLESDWSDPVPFLTAPDTWPAAPIWADGESDWALLRTEIDLPAVPVREGVIELVGLSPEGGPGGAGGPRGGRQHVAKLWVNGAATGYGSVRSADHHPALHTYRVTDRLTPGTNALAVLAWAQEGRQVAARLLVLLEDGTRIEHLSGPDTWHARPGDRLLPGSRNIGGAWYHAPAEDWDLREEPVGWTDAGFDDSEWAPATAAPALPAAPVRSTRTTRSCTRACSSTWVRWWTPSSTRSRCPSRSARSTRG